MVDIKRQRGKLMKTYGFKFSYFRPNDPNLPFLNLYHQGAVSNPNGYNTEIHPELVSYIITNLAPRLKKQRIDNVAKCFVFDTATNNTKTKHRIVVLNKKTYAELYYHEFTCNRELEMLLVNTNRQFSTFDHRLVVSPTQHALLDRCHRLGILTYNWYINPFQQKNWIYLHDVVVKPEIVELLFFNDQKPKASFQIVNEFNTSENQTYYLIQSERYNKFKFDLFVVKDGLYEEIDIKTFGESLNKLLHIFMKADAYLANKSGPEFNVSEYYDGTLPAKSLFTPNGTAIDIYNSPPLKKYMAIEVIYAKPPQPSRITTQDIYE